MGMVKSGCGQSCDGSLKLTVSEEWTGGINWFFVRSYRFLKIKSWSKFLGGLVKNGCGQSGHWTNGLYLKNEQMNEMIFYMLVQIHET